MNVKNDEQNPSSRYPAVARALQAASMILFLLLVAPTPWRDVRYVGLIFISSGIIVFLKRSDRSVDPENLEASDSLLHSPVVQERVMIAISVVSIVAGVGQIVWFTPGR